MAKKCEYCDEDAKCAGLCGNHYNMKRYWFRQGVARAQKHVYKLKSRAACLEGELRVDSIPVTNVVHLSKHPRFAAKPAQHVGRARRKRAG